SRGRHGQSPCVFRLRVISILIIPRRNLPEENPTQFNNTRVLQLVNTPPRLWSMSPTRRRPLDHQRLSFMPRLVDRLPADDHTNGWSALLPRREPRPCLEGDRDFDWVVVGAGYAGIAAARQLAERHPGASIALVEAGVVGENASGRNSGFAIDLPH